jgi:outer membrane lipoprotein-sorting protein
MGRRMAEPPSREIEGFIRMRCSSLAGLVTILSVCAGALPVTAQTLPLDLILPPQRPAPPATISSIAEGFNLSAAPLPTATFHPRSAPPFWAPAQAPAILVEAESEPIPPAKPIAAPKAPPLPPQPARNAAPQTASAEPIQIAPRPIVTTATGPAAIARIEQLSNKEIVERANAYFTNLGTMMADFTQIGGDGQRLGGTLYLQRPGKVRFEYDPPATLEVIADGSSVAVRDKKLATQDLYSISQTPLKFLLREKVNLGQDIAISGITSDSDSVRVALEDRSTLGGTSRITLFFDAQVETLTQWRIVDAQGFQTVVVLNKAERGRRIDQDLFKIRYEAILGGNNR